MTIRVFGGQATKVSPIALIDHQETMNYITDPTLTINAPINTTGDYLVAYVYTADSSAVPTTGNWNAPSGWTKIYSGSKQPNLDIYYKVATASEPTTYSWSFSRSNFYLGGFILSYRNAAGVGLVGEAPNNGGSYTQQTAPGATISFGKSLILASFFNTDDSLYFTPPTGFTEILNYQGGTFGFASITGGGGGASLSTTSFSVSSKVISSFTIPSSTATLSAASALDGEAVQIYILDKSTVTTLSSYSYDYLTQGLSQSPVSTSVTVQAIGPSPDNTVTCPSGVTFDKNLSGTFVSSGTVVKNDVLRFKITSTGTSYNVTQNYTVTIGITKFTLTYDTNNYLVFTGSGSFTVPPGVSSISILALGAGGGGRGGAVDVSPGIGGAGGGALSYKNNIAVTGGSTVVSVTVGAGGVGGNALNSAGTNGGDTFASIGGVTQVLAKGGLGKINQTAGGQVGGDAAAGIGDVKFSGGAGATTSTAYTNGTSGGGGGGAATPAGAGPTGQFNALQSTYFTGGKGGQGISFSVGATGSWSTVATAWTSGYNGGNGQQRGGGGGSPYVYNATYSQYLGGDGGGGYLIVVWGGRTFSSASTF